jgi:hypothetical protein
MVGAVGMARRLTAVVGLIFLLGVCRHVVASGPPADAESLARNSLGASSMRAGRKPPRVVLMTAIFGPALPPYFPFFLKSLENCGADVIIVGAVGGAESGSTSMKWTLPSNVRHIPMKWTDLTDLVSTKVFAGNPMPKMEKAKVYKVVDLKPLFGFLFRDLITDYEFWGHIDNDMLLGNVGEILHPLLDDHDVIIPNQQDCADKDCDRTWGPFTLYRNVPRITELFRLGNKGLYHIMNSATIYFFDEWGGMRGSEHTYYASSMTAIINKQVKRLNVRHFSGGVPVGWDGECQHSNDPRCSECVMTTESGKRKLVWNRTATGTFEDNTYPVLLCHFQHGKNKTAQQLKALSAASTETLLNAERLVWNYDMGFHV